MELAAWQRRACNLLGLAPVYQSTVTTPDRLVLHAANGFILSKDLSARLAALGLLAEVRAIKGEPYFEIVILQV
jgi:hypothetical protein